MKTVFITGASSGIGRETAKYFQKMGWGVIATMRNPKIEYELTALENVKVIPCDVTERESIHEAVRRAIGAFGHIDVLVNNAGYYAVGPLEAAKHEEIKRELDTNLLGVIEMTQAVIPYLREARSGRIINLSSIAGQISIPLQSLYHATKFGIEGFSESLQYELGRFNIKVKLIEPGTIKTEFCGRSMTKLEDGSLTDYLPYAPKVLANLIKNGNEGSSPKGVAETIYKAATDRGNKMRYPTGKMKGMISLRKWLPLGLYMKLVGNIMEK